MNTYELLNPFTPASIASNPEDFYGRATEITSIDRNLKQGSLVIQGPPGIGKSSLLSRVLLHMEGFSSNNNSKVVIAVAHSDIETVDDAARLLLEELCVVDEVSKKISIDLPKLISYESQKAYNYFAEGRFLSSLLKIIEDKKFKDDINEANLIIFAIDECDKCPKPIARLIRQILTKTQLNGINSIRFVLAGISPLYEDLVNEDIGINRFIYKTINLGKLKPDEAKELIEDKLYAVVFDVQKSNLKLDIDPLTIDRVYSLANGHPHLLQLLGSYLIENENNNPDEIINSYDLVNALQEICYETRATIYDYLMRSLELHGYYEDFLKFINLSKNNFPTVVDKAKVQQFIEPQSILWLLKNNIIAENNNNQFELVDEFLRIRIFLDQEKEKEDASWRVMEISTADIDNISDNSHAYWEHYR